MTRPHKNKTGFTGVTFDARSGRYRAAAKVGSKRVALGTYQTALDAAAAYRAFVGPPKKPKSYMKRKRVFEHRAVWEEANGPVPPGYFVDHIDGDKHNNDISNLRLATASQQQWNKGAYRNSKTGVKGVMIRRDTGRFYSDIVASGVRHRLGSFGTIEEAATAYAAAASRLHGEFACTRTPQHGGDDE